MNLFEKYQENIEKAISAVHHRTFYAAYQEMPKAYAENASSSGMSSYEKMLGKKFDQLLQPSSENVSCEEVSPYTQKPLGISYPVYTAIDIILTSKKAFSQWKKTSPAERAGVLMDSLEKMKDHFFEIAYATQHTTGQSWIMSFQASGPHAADRALEAIALGYEEQNRFPEKITWEKPAGKTVLKVEKDYRIMPHGIGLVIGCSTFPVWNSLPGIYANLVTGNSVIVKPHPKCILPIAICVALIQQTLHENGFDPLTIQLAADTSAAPIAKELAAHPDVKLIDYTGSTTFGDYLESLPGKITFTEKAGVNPVIIDSVNDLDAVVQNLAFSVSLYSGQMCTAPQNFFVAEKIKVGDKELSFDEVAAKLKDAISQLSSNPKMGAGVLGAIQNENTLHRAKQAATSGGKILLDSLEIKNEEFTHARTISPVLIESEPHQAKTFEHEWFGPVSVIIKTKNTEESIQLAKSLAVQQGAITCAAYTIDEKIMKEITDEMNDVFVPVTFNFVGPIWVNQHAAFSDFHVTGGNRAGNGSFTNPEFIVKRFVWVGNRIMK